MHIQLLIFLIAALAVLISFYVQKSLAALAASLDKKIPTDYFQKYSRIFLLVGILGFPVGLLNHFSLSIFYIIGLLAVSAVFGISFSKKI